MKHPRAHTQKKRRSSSSSGAKKMDVLTIPELRRAFNYIEDYGQTLVKKPTAQAVASFQDEWQKVFKKEIDHKAAAAYIAHLKDLVQHAPKHAPKHTRKHRKHRGGAAALDGAPLMHTDRAGVYISPGVNQGSYALVPAYVDKGFWNPEQAHQYDPVPYQTSYPTRVPFGMGSNQVGGMAPLDQAFSLSAVNQAMFRPVPSSVPPSLGQDATTAWNGQPLGASPDPTQTRLSYQMAPNAGPRSIPTAEPIKVQLSDISTN